MNIKQKNISMNSKRINKTKTSSFHKIKASIFNVLLTGCLLSSSFIGLLSSANAQFSISPGYNSDYVKGDTSWDSKKLASIGHFEGNNSGQLEITGGTNTYETTLCPLEKTDVQAKISGSVASITVSQKFHNPSSKNIEAIYKFPLSHNASVDDMVLKIGDKTIHATISEKANAQQIYNTAKAQGKTASLLTQQKPNIFTQAVANIRPNEVVEIKIHYFELLNFFDGTFSLAVPTVVGPRFNPNGENAEITCANSGYQESTGDTIYKNRSGHNISINVQLNGGVKISNIKSLLHDVYVSKIDSTSSNIILANKNEIPNKDFILNWQVSDKFIKTGYMTHKVGEVGHLALMIIPPKRVTAESAQPKEMIFIVDKSGSQQGAPMAKCRETMNYILDHMNPNDTFQVITFDNDATTLFEKPMKINNQTKTKAKEFISGLRASGGTYMAKALEKVIETPKAKNRLRIVTMMTDGLIGNDYEILNTVKKTNKTARWFSFGVGNSTNRFIIDGIAKEGGGESEYVDLKKSGEEVAKRFYNRISTPVLSDVSIKFKGEQPVDITPRRFKDVWAHKPLYLTARFKNPGRTKAIIQGYSAGKRYKKTLNIVLPKESHINPAIKSLWARQMIDELMAGDWQGLHSHTFKREQEELITKISLEYRILTQFTSFVAVDEDHESNPQQIKTLSVPLEMPDGIENQKKDSQTDTTSYPNYSNQSISYVSSQSQSSFNPMVQTKNLLSIGGSATRIKNWLVADCRDANLFCGGEMAPIPVLPNVDSPSQNRDSQATIVYSYSPTLQGATNGSIGPQGGDATAIMGVNTAGTVRVNNLANLEALLNLVATGFDMLFYGIALVCLFRGLMMFKARDYKGGFKQLAYSVSWVLLGVFMLPFAIMFYGFKLSAKAINLSIKSLRGMVKPLLNN